MGMVLFLCRDAVGVFNSPSQLNSHWWGWSYSSAEMQSVYSTAPANWTLIGGDGLIPLQRCSRCIQQPQPIELSLVGMVLFLCRDAVGVFNIPSQLDSHWWGWFIPLQRCSRSIQQPQPIELSLVEMVLFLCRDVVGVFYSPSQLNSHWWRWSYSSAEM